MMLTVFLLNPEIFEDKGVVMNVWTDFWTKQTKKSHVRKPIGKHKFYSFNRKMENVIRRIFASVIIPLNFISFHPKVGFKIVLGTFTSFSWRLRTALKSASDLRCFLRCWGSPVFFSFLSCFIPIYLFVYLFLKF